MGGIRRSILIVYMIKINKSLVPSLLLFTLLMDFEKFAQTPYEDGAGTMTIGYGHAIKEDESFTSITEKEARALLLEDVESHRDSINNLVDVPLNQHQYDALVSFVFNIGEDVFRKSGLLRELNKGNYNEVPRRFMMYINDVQPDGTKKVVKGLIPRRKAEVDMWHGKYHPDNKYK